MFGGEETRRHPEDPQPITAIMSIHRCRSITIDPLFQVNWADTIFFEGVCGRSKGPIYTGYQNQTKPFHSDGNDMSNPCPLLLCPTTAAFRRAARRGLPAVARQVERQVEKPTVQCETWGRRGRARPRSRAVLQCGTRGTRHFKPVLSLMISFHHMHKYVYMYIQIRHSRPFWTMSGCWCFFRKRSPDGTCVPV